MTESLDPTTVWIPGVHGNALKFDGVDGEVPLPGVPASVLPVGDAPRTIMAWIRTSPANENQTIFGYGANSNGQRFSLRTNGSAGSPANQPLRLEVQGGFIVGSTNLNDGNWHHIAVVCDDFDSSGTMNVNESKLYVDGRLEVISNRGSREINTAAGSIPVLGGSNHGSNYSFAGAIDELRLYPLALSQAQVKAIHDGSHEAAIAWHRANFGPASINWNADQDGDGSVRLAEYALGKNPHRADFSPLIESSFHDVAGILSVQYRRLLIPQPGVWYTVEASNDLIDWESLTVTQTEVSAVAGEPAIQVVEFEADATTADEPVQFIRLRVGLE
jgi:hypothetical protein